MTRLIARLILAMLCLPIAAVLFVLLFIVAVARFSTPTGPPSVPAVLTVWTAIYIFIAIYWSALWWPLIRWNPRRTLHTILAVPLALLLGFTLGASMYALTASSGAPLEIFVILAGGIPPGAWMIATVFIWRESPAERAARLAASGADTLACPVCAYNMTGMRSSDCPECGARFTLDQLLAAQPHRDHATLPNA